MYDINHNWEPPVTGLPRSFLSEPRFFFESMRRSFAARPGRVGIRFGAVLKTLLIRVTSLDCASWRFFSWLRWFCALMIRTPSLLIRWSFSSSRRRFMLSLSEEAGISKRRCMAEETLLTFCPPAPWARIALISISSSPRLSCSLIFNMPYCSGSARALLPLRNFPWLSP